MNRTTRLIAAVAILPLGLTACGGGGEEEAAAKEGEISYWMWDANQQPAYEACAKAFTEANPDLSVKITQLGWDDYWSTLTTRFVSGDAPDVFTNHLTKYPELVDQDQLVPLDDAVEAAGVDTTGYAEGLAELWVDQEGARYGLPKDWDTVAMFYNKAMFAEAGVDEASLASLTWNPQDGGTYEDLVARMTVDANGVRGDEPGFDPKNVAVYGLGLGGSGGERGQTEWSQYTATTGWTHTDKNPWGTKYNFDDPRFQETMGWFAGLVDKGYMPPLETTVGASMNDGFAAGKSAINMNGSWMIGTYAGYEDIELGIAPTPVGPSGQRASMFNGLADSVWAGSEQQENATKWVLFMASADCQDLVAEQAVVFPALKSSLPAAEEAFAAKGVDVSAFTVHVEEGTTFLTPITGYAGDVTAIMTPAMDAVVSGQAPPSSLTAANEEVNALFEE